MQLGGRTLIDGLTLHMVQGERIGIVGPNGAGKTTLLGLVCQELAPTRGPRRARHAHQDRVLRSSARRPARRLVACSTTSRAGKARSATAARRCRSARSRSTLRQYLERFLFDGGKQRQPVSSLSGGERARVALAKALRTGANMLLLDEPTNDLDVATLGALEEMLVGVAGLRAGRVARSRVLEPRRDFDPGVRGRRQGRALPGRLRQYRSLRDAAKARAQEDAREANQQQKAKASVAPASTARGARRRASRQPKA